MCIRHRLLRHSFSGTPLRPCLLRSPALLPPLRSQAARQISSSNLVRDIAPTPGTPQSSPTIDVPTTGTTDQTLNFLVQHVLELKQSVAGMDKNIAIMAIELHVVSGILTTVCASGLGLLMWHIKESIKESRKKDV